MTKFLKFISLVLMFGVAKNDLVFAQLTDEYGSVGHYSNGCIDETEALELSGFGLEVMRPSRKRYYGHQVLDRYIKNLGSEVKRAEAGTLLVGDLGLVQGGKMPGAHVSHQNGLDVDIWLWLNSVANKRPLTKSERENLSAKLFVDLGTLKMIPGTWTENHQTLFELAAKPDEVQRIFINPRIKKTLCDAGMDKKLLRKLRPWWRHHEHLHVRLKCPEGSRFCKPQADPPAGDGCGKELDDWLSGKILPPEPGSAPTPPELCKKIWGKR